MIWITGSNGMLGRELCLMFQNKSLSYISTDIELDITDSVSIMNFIKDKKIDWVVNCSAYTAVDFAEDEKDMAFLVNAQGVKNLALAASELQAKIIHFSTDYVFNGTKKDGYAEDDSVEPLNVYGASKLEGEKLLAQNYDKFFIFRISWLYGAYGKNFVQTMLNLFSTRDQISVVNDQFGSPTNTFELAAFIADVIKSDSEKFGIYHFSGEGMISWYDFALEIYRLAVENKMIDNICSIHPINSKSYPTKAKRPEFSYLLKFALYKNFSYKPSLWTESLHDFIVELKSKM